MLAAVPDAGQTGLLDLPPDRLDLMSRQAERSGVASLTRAAEIMSNGLDQMRGATSPRLLLELMCAQVLLPSANSDEKAFWPGWNGWSAEAVWPARRSPARGRPRATGPGARPIPPGRQRRRARPAGRVRDRLRPRVPFPPRGRRAPAEGGPARGAPAPGRPRPAGDDVVSGPAPAAAGPAASADDDKLPPDASPAGARRPAPAGAEVGQPQLGRDPRRHQA